MTARAAPTFNPRVVLGMLVFGAIAFIAMLYFIGAGETGRGDNDGGAHGAARGLTGYAALAQLLEGRGHRVSLSTSAARLDDSDLLILTPPHFTDAEELTELIERRRYQGPTLVILPKWFAREVPPSADVEAEDGWVVLGGSQEPFWLEMLEGDLALGAEIAELDRGGDHWRGLGRSGALPDPGQVMAFTEASLVSVLEDSKGRVVAGYLDDGGYYPLLDAAVGVPAGDPDELDGDRWNVMFVAEPDLFNNYGMADRERAALALELVELTMEGEELDIVFDLTLNGLGRTQNLLTLAFAPPFLAATLCLILAMIVVAWRAFRRFGPPLAEARAIAFGKTRLVANSAGFIERTGRMHLLTRPYASLMAQRIARLLGLRRADEAAIDEALLRRRTDAPPFSAAAARLRAARTKQETLRAARALKDIERTLTQ